MDVRRTDRDGVDADSGLDVRLLGRDALLVFEDGLLAQRIDKGRPAGARLACTSEQRIPKQVSGGKRCERGFGGERGSTERRTEGLTDDHDSQTEGLLHSLAPSCKGGSRTAHPGIRCRSGRGAKNGGQRVDGVCSSGPLRSVRSPVFRPWLALPGSPLTDCARRASGGGAHNSSRGAKDCGVQRASSLREEESVESRHALWFRRRAPE